MSITPTEFKVRFPEFDLVLDARITTFINKALLNIDVGVWGNYYEEGQLYLTAHFLQLAIQSENSDGSTSGNAPISSKKIGDVAISFAVGSVESGTSAAYFNSTAYGQEYWRLCKIVGEGMVVVI